ncbi:hypothetical protein Btru_036327 [Bulinus truncatus]|nr:hypothetical protein Btru_036327 [Bulinus truncatus]
MECDFSNTDLKTDESSVKMDEKRKVSSKRVFLKMSQFPSKESLHKIIKDAHEREIPKRKHYRAMSLAARRCTYKSFSESYQLGDMFWAKIRGYPFWPCMISRDPFSNLFVKVSGKSKAYHVQFFGRGYYRSWVKETSMLKYNGREQYFEIAKYGPDNITKYCRPLKDYIVTPPWFPSWNMAVFDSERAFKLSQEERKDQYTFHYMYKMGGKEFSVRKMVKRFRKQLLQLSDESSTSEDSQDEEQICQPAKKKYQGVKGNFEVYYARHAKFVETEHPSWNMSDVLNHLEQKWSQLSQPERRIYQLRTIRSSNMNSSSTLRSKKVNKREQEVNSRMIKINPESLNLQISKLVNQINICDAKPSCKVCKKIGKQLQICKGICQQHIHTKCGKTAENKMVFCEDCLTDVQICFICKSQEETTMKCSRMTCSVYYHESCVTNLKHTKVLDNGFICPLHTCSTCLGVEATLPFIRCVQCPASYHASEFCVAAGSQVKNIQSMVCSRHYKMVPSNSHLAKISSKKCLQCSTVGKLFSCLKCPAAYCLDCFTSQLPDGLTVQQFTSRKYKPSWLCLDCKMGQMPLYGDIVWVKTKFFKWWPAEVCHPGHIPEKFQLKTSQVGRFPVRFFGSYDYTWTHQGRVLPYKKVIGQLDGGYQSGDLVGLYRLGLQEAEAAHQFCVTFRQSIGATPSMDSVKPSVNAASCEIMETPENENSDQFQRMVKTKLPNPKAVTTVCDSKYFLIEVFKS